MSSEHINPLSDRVRQASFQDARHSTHDPVLLGPPALEFAPYAKIPGSRVRKDARQGTIDQDSDFIAFLESLTQPIAKPAPVDSAEGDEKKEVVTTPLVQFIKDKKASKAKDSSSKSSKRSDKESKQEKVHAKKLLQRPDKELAPGPSADRKAKGDKLGGFKESVKAAKQAAASTTKSGKASTASATKETAAASTERKRERGNVAAAAKILQRDLGLSPSGGRRRGKGGSTEAGSPKNESSRDSSAPAGEGTKKEPAPKPAKGGQSAASLAQTVKDGESLSAKATDAATPPTTTSTPPVTSSKAAKSKPAPSPAPTATQAFLKHANPSQGVTETLLEAAFTPFGAVTKVEIDKKKGFGYVDFAEPEGLQKAMAASPVSVAQSQVVVLERKANPGGEKSLKGRGNSQQPSGSKAKASEGNAAGTAGSSRGSRGGRGARSKGKGEGSKGGNGAGSGNASAPEKTGSAEAK